MTGTDPSTDIALLYLETFGDPRRFARIARRFSRRKPILCVKSARSQAGQDVARAHIGAVAQGEPQVDLLFRQAGVVRAETLEELFDVAMLLASQPLPRGNRVAIVSNSGGVLTISADACAAHGLAIGRPGMVTTEYVAPGAVVIDVGINPLKTRDEVVRLFGEGSPRVQNFDAGKSVITGDVHPAVAEVAGALTPVPGGVGPLTIAMLLKNTLTAAESRRR